MNNRLAVVALAVPMLFSVGCVAQREYDDLQQAYRKSQEQGVELRSRIDQLSRQIEALRAGPRDAQARAEELSAERERLMQQLEQLQGKYQTLASREPVALPAEVDRALRDFAEQHSDLVQYDSERGMVKFRSDLTFALGSAEVRPDARQTLGQLSDILTQGIASQYEVRVVGHTDAVPISRPATRAKHPTNWHLSVDRAIAVRDVLDEAGVPAVRTSVAGYGKYRPLVENSRGGAEANRRVEIYLDKMGKVNQDYITRSGGGTSRAPTNGSAADGDSDGPTGSSAGQNQPPFPLK